VVVIDADVFDDIFGGLVAANAEGQIMSENGTAGFAFTETAVSRFTSGREPMQDAGSAVLRLAWKHRQ
jgi:hypothetical protein